VGKLLRRGPGTSASKRPRSPRSMLARSGSSLTRSRP